MKNIFECGKLEESLVVKKFLTTASDNKKYKVMHYNLDAIIAVGIVLIQKGQQNLEYGLLKY